MKYLIALIILLNATALLAQEQIQIENAKTLKEVRFEGERAQQLKGNVIFKKDGATMYCDSAYNFQNRNLVKAYGSLKILQGDSVELTGDSLVYDGDSKMADVRGEEVVMKDNDMTLYTTSLHYNLGTKTAYYLVGGKLVSEENTLTSKKGYYYSKQKNVYFKDSVVLVNPDYKMYSDTLRYHTPSETAYFLGPTEIISDSNYIYCENGWYNTQTNKSRFGENAYLYGDGQYLYGDSLYYDRNLAYGYAKKNVKIVDTANNTNIYGQWAEYFEDKDSSYITDSAFVEQVSDQDTFFMHADTLLSITDSAGEREIFAFYGVRAYSIDFQASGDSMAYITKDSLIHVYGDPIAWFDNYQATADSMKMRTDSSGIKRFYMYSNSILISQLDTARYNQIRGKEMKGFLRDNDIYRLDVYGNGEAIYFLRDDQKRYTGVNTIRSTDVKIRIKDNEIQSINFMKDPEGIIEPMGAKSSSSYRLEGFSWQIEHRPLEKNDIFKQN